MADPFTPRMADPWAWSLNAAPFDPPASDPEPTFWRRLAATYADHGGLAGLLPPEARKRWAPWAHALNPLEWTPGAAIRDAVQASGDTSRAFLAAQPMEMLNSSASMLAALAAIAPGAGFAKNVAKNIAEALPPAATRAEQLSLEQALRQRPIVHATDAQGARGILREGQFKSQFETGTSGGLFDPVTRAAVEQQMFRLPIDTDPLLRPIYGAMGLAPHMPRVNQYGDYVFVFRPEVKDRATYTLGDSLSGKLRPRQWQRPGDDTKLATGVFPYVEAQISRKKQGLPMDDVAAVLVRDPATTGLRRVRQQLDKRGIPYEIAPPDLFGTALVDWWRRFGLMAPPVALGGLFATVAEESP